MNGFLKFFISALCSAFFFAGFPAVAESVEQKTVSFNDEVDMTVFHYTESGQGEPLLLHSGRMTSAEWTVQVALFARHFRFPELWFDLRNHPSKNLFN